MSFDFSKYDKVFCDSEVALKYLIDNNLKKNSKILTFSPSIIANSNYYKDYIICNISENWNKNKLIDYQSSKKIFLKKIYSECQNNKFMKKYSNLILNFIGVYCRNIYKAGFLKNIDLEEEALLVNINENSNPILQYINPPWQRLLKNNKQLDVFNYKFITDNNAFLDSPSFILRLRSAGFKSIIYRIFLSIYQKKYLKM